MAAASPTDLRDRLTGLTLRDEHRLRRRLDRARRDERADALARLTGEIEQAEARVGRRRAAVPEVSYPAALPVSARREDLLAAIGEHQVVVVAGETGSGKTTQLPKLCLELGRGVRGTIGHTQPRRIAARTVAERIADELDVPLGEAVGYAVRFNDRTGEDTLVRVMTDGLLLAEVQRDRLLRRYDTIIVDEAHERSLNIDFLLGYLQRILPQRPDLKLLITSATIDPQRFAAHFGDAPVVEVSGRTFPVEVRHRPLVVPVPGDEDGAVVERDQVEGVGDAVEELLRAERGDVLVFLSGEREIRDAAEALRSRLPHDVEVLPLFARLSVAEQQRIFRPHDARRVVLATNVAETSLTVPGIRSVVDVGTARISRYSARLKVQRLPIEPISQASADQRKGRCGRTSDGICIRLYDEEDFASRPRFTDPEILRTSLASVILQMASIDLGDVEDFPFLDPPDRRQVRDGLTLLHELGAIEPAGRRLTALGRRLAQLPVDPRLGRMVLEADRLDCADEVIVIAAALSIQDVRERPADQQAQADQQHARFADPASDFLALLNLWRHLREQQRELSGNAFRRKCKAEFLHYVRIREWQDLVAQLRQAAKGAGVKLNQAAAEPDQVHQALLSGLLSHVGVRDGGRREYLGARGARFTLFPGSAVSRTPPSWVMVSELVETSRLFGRTAARIDPGWVEPLAGHLVKRTYADPHWERKRASVIATERVTLFGLPVVAGRRVAYGPIDPALSRIELLRRGLVEGDWDARHAFLSENRALVEEVRALEERARRRDLLVGDEALVAFYDARVPSSVVSGAHFDRWWKRAREQTPDLLTFRRSDVVAADAADALDEGARPSAWTQGALTLPLTYVFDPGAERDGVTAHVPLPALGQLRDEGFDWLVPALRPELVTALVRSLPKELRRPLVPVPDVVAQVVPRLDPAAGDPLVVALARELGRLRGVRIDPAAFDAAKLPSHLRMHFRVEDERGAALAEGSSLDVLRGALRPKLQASLTAAASTLEQRGLVAWTVGTLPRAVTLPGTGQAVRAYPALVDEGVTAGVRVLDSPAEQAVAMRAGTRRLLLLGVPSPVRDVARRLAGPAQLALAAAPHGSAGAALEDALRASVDALVDEAGGPAWDEAGFAGLRAHVAGGLHARLTTVVDALVRILDAARDVQRRLEDPAPEPLWPARRDVERQVRRLVHDGFVAEVGAGRLADIERYLQGAARRLDRLADTRATDLDRMGAITALEDELNARLDAWPAGRPLPDGLREVPWLLEELRISQFAQGLGVRGQVSAKRIRKLLA